MGFIVAQKNDSGVIVNYWDGTLFQSEIDNADVVQTKSEARFLQAGVQSQDTSFDVVYLAVTVNIELAV